MHQACARWKDSKYTVGTHAIRWTLCREVLTLERTFLVSSSQLRNFFLGTIAPTPCCDTSLLFTRGTLLPTFKKKMESNYASIWQQNLWQPSNASRLASEWDAQSIHLIRRTEAICSPTKSPCLFSTGINSGRSCLERDTGYCHWSAAE